MVSHATSPEDCPDLSVEFLEVFYDNQFDYEYVPHAIYTHPDTHEAEVLGPLDLELSGDGNEVYMDGTDPEVEARLRQLGGMAAWAKIAFDMHGHIPLAETFYVRGIEYHFDRTDEQDLSLAA